MRRPSRNVQEDLAGFQMWLREPGNVRFKARRPQREPVYLPDDGALPEYLSVELPDWELFGPVRSGYVGPASKEGFNRVLIYADLTENGIEDCIAILRSRSHAEEAIAAAFIQRAPGQYEHHIIPAWVSEYGSYVRLISLGEARKRLRDSGTTDKGVERNSAPDERPAVLLGTLAESEHVFFVTADGIPCTWKFGC